MFTALAIKHRLTKAVIFTALVCNNKRFTAFLVAMTVTVAWLFVPSR